MVGDSWIFAIQWKDSPMPMHECAHARTHTHTHPTPVCFLLWSQPRIQDRQMGGLALQVQMPITSCSFPELSFAPGPARAPARACGCCEGLHWGVEKTCTNTDVLSSKGLFIGIALVRP